MKSAASETARQGAGSNGRKAGDASAAVPRGEKAGASPVDAGATPMNGKRAGRREKKGPPLPK